MKRMTKEQQAEWVREARDRQYSQRTSGHLIGKRHEGPLRPEQRPARRIEPTIGHQDPYK